MTVDEIRYALAKQIPAMRFEVILHTDYGNLHLFDQEAAMVATLVQHLLEDKLQQQER